MNILSFAFNPASPLHQQPKRERQEGKEEPRKEELPRKEEPRKEELPRKDEPRKQRKEELGKEPGQKSSRKGETGEVRLSALIIVMYLWWNLIRTFIKNFPYLRTFS